MGTVQYRVLAISFLPFTRMPANNHPADVFSTLSITSVDYEVTVELLISLD